MPILQFHLDFVNFIIVAVFLGFQAERQNSGSLRFTKKIL